MREEVCMKCGQVRGDADSAPCARGYHTWVLTEKEEEQSMSRVLLAGGNVAGRIVEMRDDATELRLMVPDYSTGPPYPQMVQVYRPTGEMSTSGFPVWAVVLPDDPAPAP